MADNEWTGLINVTMPKYLKGAIDACVRRRLILKMLQQRGRITFNNGSFKCIWDVEYREPPIEAYGDGGQLTFGRGDYYKQAENDWRGYKGTDLMTEKERDMFTAEYQIVRRYGTKIPKLLKAIRNKFGSEIYIDGNLAANVNRLHGSASWAGTGTTVAADRICEPSDTYANISTAVGQYDTWTTTSGLTAPNANIGTDWPEGGAGDTTGYDYWAPKIANWSGSGWGTSSSAWIDNAEFVLRKMQQWLSLTVGVDAADLVVMLAGDMFTDFKNAEGAKGRNILPHTESRDLGFADEVLNFDGLRLKSEFGITANTGWFFNVGEMELASLKKTLFGSQGPVFDIKTAAWLTSVGFFGDLIWSSPKFHGKILNEAS